MADQWAAGAAKREHRASTGGGAEQTVLAAGKTISRTFLKSVLRGRAVEEWKREIEKRS